MQAACAAVVLPCAELGETLAFFERLGFRLESIHPADDPSVAVVSGHGVRVCLRRGEAGAGATGVTPGVMRLLCRDPEAVAGGARELVAPNGTRIELGQLDPPVVVPPAAATFTLSRLRDAHWVEGRAGMRYRDLAPGRLGGHLVASHIQITEGGPVPDYVHFHAVAFQLIYCRSGWVRVVYEDQGPPFVLNDGDCVLQPPRIRHRVLEASPGLEVVEVTVPAEHETFVDHTMILPTLALRPERDFGGQRFVRNEAASAPWRRREGEGSEGDGAMVRDLGIAAATHGAFDAHVVRFGDGARATASSLAPNGGTTLLFAFVLAGDAELACGDGPLQRIGAGDACVVPPGAPHALAVHRDLLELLVVVSTSVRDGGTT
jgi:quercetin dioxygenase-like cupin family protein